MAEWARKFGVSESFLREGVAAAARELPKPADNLRKTGFSVPQAYLYVFEAQLPGRKRLEGALCKIGVSTRPFHRFAAIQNCCPLPLSIVALGLTERAYQKEHVIHRKLDGARVRGSGQEWFYLDWADFRRVKAVINSYGLPPETLKSWNAHLDTDRFDLPRYPFECNFIL